jgi:type VI secretion system secreted protein VgrG
MAESDRLSRHVTGRQSAHLEIICRAGEESAEEQQEWRAPDLSVADWEVREEVCQPYRIRALVSTPGPVARKDILGQWAKFWFQTEEDAQRREFWGFVSRLASVSQSRDGCTYRIEVRQRLAMLDGPSNCATYQDKTSAEIIQAVMGRHENRYWMRVETRLRRPHPKHRFRFQYNMGDWAYCRLEMEQAGLFCFTESDEHGEVLVIADDIDGYTRPAIGLKDRPASGLLTFDESIYSLKVRTRAIPESFIVADYNPENHAMIFREEAQARDEFGIRQHDGTTMGRPVVWGTHHEDAGGAKREATLRHEAARAQQVSCKARSTMPSIRPGCIVRPDTVGDGNRAALDAIEGLFVWRVVHHGARNQNYRNTFRAIPANRPYRLPIDESRWPRIHGTLGLTITSPDKYKFPYLTEKGEVVGRFHCDFGNWPRGAESIPLRMAKPFASRDYAGLNMPPVDGDEALVGFREGNPNRPVILAFMPNAVNPDLINSSRRRISRSEIRTRSGNKLWFDDWDNQEGIELGTEHSGRSQLSLGFIPDHDLKARGAGAELRTAGHLVGRGGSGVMVTAYNQAGDSGRVLAMDETDAQLKDHQRFAETLSQSAEASKASPADTDAQKAIREGLHELKRPGVLVTGPGPVAVASGDGVQLAADGSIIGTAKKGIHFSTLRRFTATAGDLLSLFTQKGMSLIAAAGAVVVQAQRGRMQLAAQEDMSVESVAGVVHVKAAKEIILNVSGTYVKLTGEGVEIGSRGGVLYRTASVKGIGPAQMDLGGAAFAPKFVPYTTDCEVWRSNPGFVSPPSAPAPMPAQWEGLANTIAAAPAPEAGAVAPSALGDFFHGNSSPLKINDPENAPKTGSEIDADEYPKGIKLETPASCNWTMPTFKENATLKRETPTYYRYGIDNSAPEKDANHDLISWAGPADTTCHFSYDSGAKTLTARVVIALVPRLLVRMNPLTRQPLRDATGQYIVVNYETVNNGANSGKTFSQLGLMLIDRDIGDVNGAVYKNLIEKTLNQGGYKLIIDGCSKGASCGCRVSVKLCADIQVVTPAEATRLNADKTINLFPEVDRADANNWPAADHYGVDNSGQRTTENWQVKAHETGHLFAFPDEYWKHGGFVHKQYVKSDMTLDFALGAANADDNKTWQIESSDNLMGYGCNKSRAAIQPYYLEYIRQWFSKHTNKKWRVGYGG